METINISTCTAYEKKYTDFVLTILEQEDYYIKFEVTHVTSWNMDDSIYETEPYLKGSIKRTGCSTIAFTNESYHLCGVDYWKMHAKVMELIYKIITSKITDFYKTEVWKE